jgi:N-formylglutamate amidohydrolase
MGLSDGDIQDLEFRIRSLFEEYGAEVTRLSPRVSWHTEFPNSAIYDIRGMLIFAPEGNREREVATISFNFGASRTPVWEIDMVDDEWTMLAADSQSAHDANANLTTQHIETRIREFLNSHRDRLVAQLQRMPDINWS